MTTAPPDDSPAPKRRWIRRTLGTVVVLLVAAYLLRNLLFAGMLGEYVGERLTAELGFPVTVERVEGNWFSTAELVGVRGASTDAGSTLASLRCDRLGVEYALLTVLSDPVAGVNGIDARGLHVQLRADQGGEAGETRLRDVLKKVPAGVAVHADGSIRIVRTSPTEEAIAAVDAFDVDGSTDGVTLTLRGLASPHLPTEREEGPVEIVLTRVGEVRFEVRMDTPFLGATVTSATAGLTAADTWQIRLSGGFAGGTVDLSWDEGPVSGAVESVDVARVPAWLLRRLEEHVEPPSAGVVTGTFVLRPFEGALEAETEVRDLRWTAYSADRLVVKAGIAADRVRLDSVVFRRAGLAATLGEVVLDTEAPFGVASVASIEVAAADLRADLAACGLELDDPLDAGPYGVQVSGSYAERTLRTTGADVRMPGGSVTYEGTIELPRELATDDGAWRRLEFDGRFGARIDHEQPPAPLADLFRSAWARPTSDLEVSGRVTGTAEAPRLELDGAATGLATPVGPVRLVQLRGSVDSAGVRDLRIGLDGSVRLRTIVDVERSSGRVRMRALEGGVGPVTSWTGPLEDAAVALRAAEMEGELSAVFPFDDWTGQREQIDALLASVRGRLSLTTEGLRFSATTLARARADVRFEESGWTVERGEVTDDRVHLRANAGWRPGAAFVDVSDVTLAATDARLLDEFLEDAPVSWIGLRARGGGRIDLAEPLHSTGTWSATLDRLNAEGVTAKKVAVEVVFEDDAWTLRRLQGNVETTVQERTLAGELRTTEPVRLMLSAERDRAEIVSGRLSFLDADFEPRGTVADASDLRLRASGLSLDVAGLEGLTGEIDLDARVRTSRTRIEHWEIDATGRSLRYRDQVADLRCEATQTARGIEVEECVLNAGDAGRLELAGTLPWRLDLDGVRATNDAAASYRASFATAHPEAWLTRLLGPLPERLEPGSIAADVSFAGGRLDATASWNGLAWRGRGGTRLAVEQPVRLSIAGASDGVRLSLTGGAPLELDGSLDVTGALDWAQPWTLPDAVRTCRLDGRLRLDVADLAPFAIVSPDLVFAGGRLRANAVLGGTGASPVVRGDLTGSELTARVEGDLPVLDKGDVRLTVDANGMDIGTCTARLGYAPVELAGGVRRAGDGAWTADLAMKGRRALLARSEYVRLRADLDVAIRGPVDALRITGAAKVTDALFSRPMDLLGGGGGSSARDFELFSLRDAPLSTARFDVHVTADRTIRIHNNRARGSLSADVHLLGTGAAPFPRGRVTLDEGTIITLPFSRLTTERGVMTFPDLNPYDPQIELQATSRMKGYDLSVDVSGRVSAARVHVSTLPALTPEQALLLLSTGSTPEELERDGLSTTAVTKAGTLIGTRIVNWFTGPGDPDSDSLLDRVKLEIGRDVSRSGAETVDAEFELTSRWYLRAERDRYDAYNGGLVWRIRFR